MCSSDLDGESSNPQQSHHKSVQEDILVVSDSAAAVDNESSNERRAQIGEDWSDFDELIAELERLENLSGQPCDSDHEKPAYQAATTSCKDASSCSSNSMLIESEVTRNESEELPSWRCDFTRYLYNTFQWRDSVVKTKKLTQCGGVKLARLDGREFAVFPSSGFMLNLAFLDSVLELIHVVRFVRDRHGFQAIYIRV